jgi:2-polyprenyl-6-methoxyphenol hydroxylase-like FAD-dependent oxidoreductase
MPDRSPAHTDVLIVGGGPAGLTLGVTLAQLGIDHVVIDPKPAVAPGSKAAAVQPRTLEYLDRVGLADRLIEHGLQGSGFAAADGDRHLLRLSYENIASPYPFLLLISQQQTEIRLEQRLQELGSRVFRGVRLLDMVDEFPGSAATVVTQDGTPQVITARYVIGADGVHSTVRERRGVSFPGDSPTHLFALADVVLEGDDTVGMDTTFSFSPHGMLLTSALPGGQLRVVASVPPGTSAPDEADIARLLHERGARWAREATVKSVAANSTYQVQQRVVTSMRSGNAFLVGDAAHTHSPAGGQGMNTGIQDAANLGWKLHHVLTGRTSEHLLDTYEAERHPVAEGLIAFTAQLMDLAMVDNRDAAVLRNDVLAAAATVPGVADWLANKLSQLDIAYAPARPDDTVAGRRIDPRVAVPRGLSWTVVTPPGVSIANAPHDVALTTSADVSEPIAVRPDGIAADAALAAEALGIDVSTERALVGERV